MSRPIKFRAWDIAEKSIFAVAAIDFTVEMVYGTAPQDLSSLANCDLMQFTGFYDRYGKEIYEGDILSIVPVGSKEFRKPYLPCLVEWQPNNGCYTNWFPRGAFEIIGNKWEHPELLEGR